MLELACSRNLSCLERFKGNTENLTAVAQVAALLANKLVSGLVWVQDDWASNTSGSHCTHQNLTYSCTCGK